MSQTMRSHLIWSFGCSGNFNTKFELQTVYKTLILNYNHAIFIKRSVLIKCLTRIFLVYYSISVCPRFDSVRPIDIWCNMMLQIFHLISMDPGLFARFVWVSRWKIKIFWLNDKQTVYQFSGNWTWIFKSSRYKRFPFLQRFLYFYLWIMKPVL